MEREGRKKMPTSEDLPDTSKLTQRGQDHHISNQLVLFDL